MQIMIDTSIEKRSGLLIAAAALTMLANAEEDPGAVEDVVAGLVFKSAVSPPPRRPTPQVVPPPIGTPAPASAPAPLPADNVPPAPVEHPRVHPDADKFVPPAPPENVPAGTQDALPPPAIFGGALPFVPDVPVAPIAGAAPITSGSSNVPPAGDAPFVPAPPAGAAPSAASVPTATGTGVQPVGASGSVGGERDSKGYLWDARIHSETKKKNADGTWRFRRNLDDKVKTSVLAELNAAMGGAAPAPTFQPPANVPSAVPVPPAAATVPVPPAPPAAVPVPPVPAAGNVPVPPAPGGGSNVVAFPNPAPAAPPVPVPPPANVGVPNSGLPELVSSFRELIQLVNVSLSKGAMTQAQLSEACAHVKVESITGLASQPALVPDMYRYMRDRNWLIAAA